MHLTPRQIRALSVEADVAEPTVRRRLQGRPVRPSTSARLDAAAVRLGLPLPAARLAAGWGTHARPGASPDASTPPPSAPR